MTDEARGTGDGAGSPGLDEALAAWVEGGRTGPIRAWLGRELGRSGVPARLPADAWWPALDRLASAFDAVGPPWPAGLAARVGGLASAASALLRPDGSPAFGGGDRRRALRAWARRLGVPGLAAAARPAPGPVAGGPPLLALREARPGRDGFLAADDRGRGRAARVELFARGRAWLGPRWGPDGEPPTGPSRLIARSSGPGAELAEWRLRLGASRVTRTAVLLRGLGLALLAEELAGGDRPGWSIDLPPGVEPRPPRRGPGMALRAPGGSARLLPIGLDEHDPAGLAVEAGAIRLRREPGAARAWLPLLLSWDPTRDRRALAWRRLTVSERDRRCPPDRAFAARVVLGGGEDALVVYRSLAEPAPRAFLGHPTTARFLIGRFNARGDVVPLVTLD
jgi:hypothetical protein